jgi:hypothetical protein
MINLHTGQAGTHHYCMAAIFSPEEGETYSREKERSFFLWDRPIKEGGTSHVFSYSLIKGAQAYPCVPYDTKRNIRQTQSSSWRHNTSCKRSSMYSCVSVNGARLLPSSLRMVRSDTCLDCFYIPGFHKTEPPAETSADSSLRSPASRSPLTENGLSVFQRYTTSCDEPPDSTEAAEAASGQNQTLDPVVTSQLVSPGQSSLSLTAHSIHGPPTSINGPAGCIPAHDAFVPQLHPRALQNHCSLLLPRQAPAPEYGVFGILPVDRATNALNSVESHRTSEYCACTIAAPVITGSVMGTMPATAPSMAFTGPEGCRMAWNGLTYCHSRILVPLEISKDGGSHEQIARLGVWLKLAFPEEGKFLPSCCSSYSQSRFNEWYGKTRDVIRATLDYLAKLTEGQTVAGCSP